MKYLRVLYVVPECSDIGGIAPSTEQILLGLRDNGYQAEFVHIRATKNTLDSGTPNRRDYRGQWITGGGTGLPFHPVLGWGGLGWAAYNRQQIDNLVDHMNKFDVVIWGAAFGFNTDWYRGRHDWADLFTKVRAKKVIMLRDDHLWDAQGWYAYLDTYVDGWACVHKCSFDMAADMAAPRAIIPSPHDMGSVPHQVSGADDRFRTLFSIQNAKSWKKVDQLIRAVPYIRTLNTILAGDGLVIRNMRAPPSGGKLKPGYTGNFRLDPDLPKHRVGKPIWNIATKSEMFTYTGPMNEKARDQTYRDALFGIDLSNRTSTGQWNRVFIEAAKQGCVMMAVPRFMSGKDGDNFLQPGIHYLPVDPELTPKQLAAQIDDHCKNYGDNKQRYRKIQKTVRDLLPLFDRSKAARALVDLAMGKKPADAWAYAKGAKEHSERYTDGLESFGKLFGGTA